MAETFGRTYSLPQPVLTLPLVITMRMDCSLPAAGIVSTVATGSAACGTALPQKKSQTSPA